jgi:hypothetical protein
VPVFGGVGASGKEKYQVLKYPGEQTGCWEERMTLPGFAGEGSGRKAGKTVWLAHKKVKIVLSLT